MIDVKKLRSLIELMVDADLTEVDLESEGERVSLRRGGAGQPQVVHAIAAPAPAPVAPAPGAPGAPAEPAAATPQGPAIESPMVGTYYAAASPDSAPFVKPGDTVTADTVVCIIEAMKVFNEIKAETAGTIDAVLIESGDAVEFGQPLFRLRS